MCDVCMCVYVWCMYVHGMHFCMYVCVLFMCKAMCCVFLLCDFYEDITEN